MLSRRIWLGLTVLAMAFGLMAAAACGDDATPEVIEREVIVTQEVIVTKEVVREVEVEAKGPVITGEARPGGSLVFGGCVDTGTLHPHMHFVGHCEPGAIAIYESLVEGNWTEARSELQTEYPPAGPIPVLAESWELSDDKLTLTFHLRQGVKFHDGSDFNAEVAEMNYRSLIDEDYEFYNPRGAGFVSWTTGFIDSVRAVDDYTFEMKLTQPNFGAIDRFQVWPCCAMISGEAIRTMTPEEIGENPVGTGHFKFKSWEKGEALVLERNDDYWGEKALLDQLVVVPIVDEVARLAALVAGEIDIAVNLAPENLNLVRGLPGFEGYARLSWAYYGLNPNHREPPFDDLRVRQATSLCIDRETLSNDLMSGILKPGNQIWGVNPGRDPDAPLLPYDPDLAKQLLADAGYPDGFKTKMYGTASGLPAPTLKINNYIAVKLRNECGIDVELVNYEWETYAALWGGGIPSGEGIGLFTMSMGVGDVSGYDQYLHSESWPPDGWVVGYYANDDVDSLIEKAQNATTYEEYLTAEREAHDIALEDFAYIPVLDLYQTYGISDRVGGWTGSDSFVSRFNKAWVEYER